MEPSVALVGFYGRDNFGDDLMAVIFGSHLKCLGVPFSGFKIDPEDAGEYALSTAGSLEGLLEGRNTLVWGGGGLLVPWPNVTFNLLFPGVSREFARLVGAARKRNMRMLAFSVGGNGEAPARLTPAYIQEFLESAAHITVRNPQDLDILRRQGVPGDYFPDVVWLTPEYFPVARRPNRRLTVGIDLYWSGLLRRRGTAVVWLLRRLIRRREDCDFILLDTTRRRSGSRIRPARIMKGPNTRERPFRHLRDDLEVLASLDLIISSRLHAGVVCLAYDVPFVSVCGEGKTTLFMKNAGLSEWCFGPQDLAGFAQVLADDSRLRGLMARYPVAALSRHKAGSRGHLQRLAEAL